MQAFVIKHCNMLRTKMGDNVALETEPCAVPVNDFPVTVKTPFLFTNDTAFCKVGAERNEVTFEMTQVVGEFPFSSNIVFSLLVNLRTAICGRFRRGVRDLVEPLKTRSILAVFEHHEFGE